MITTLLISACLLGPLDHNLIGSAPASSPPAVEQVMVWHASWCGPCRGMESTVAQLQSEGYPVLWCDYDADPAGAKSWKVEQLPTVILIRDRVEQRRFVGPMVYKSLKAMMRPVKKLARVITAPVRELISSGGCPPGGCPTCPNSGGCPTRSVERVRRPSVQYVSPGYTPQSDGRCGNPGCGMCYGGRGW